MAVAHLRIVAGRDHNPSLDEWRPSEAPMLVYLLADNLDAALAAGEDLVKERLVWNSPSLDEPGDLAATRAEQRAVIGTLRSLEMMLVARVLKSRERSEELARHDKRFALIAKAYNSATATLIESVAELGDSRESDFTTGRVDTAYLRSRGLIPANASAPQDGAVIIPGDDFLVARRVRLGTLLDLVAQYLDTLELYFDLFDGSSVSDDEGDRPGEHGGDEPADDDLELALAAVRSAPTAIEGVTSPETAAETDASAPETEEEAHDPTGEPPDTHPVGATDAPQEDELGAPDLLAEVASTETAAEIPVDAADTLEPGSGEDTERSPQMAEADPDIEPASKSDEAEPGETAEPDAGDDTTSGDPSLAATAEA